MAMQQPMAGGIASVLGKPPGNPGAQAQPMIPQIGNQPGAMPMGVGSVDARAAEFMNRPQDLQKRYGMTQDTFDLMALMKIKKEKESAARQMQLQMAQQQAQGGQPPMTVKERMEQEVHDLTKNELAEQTGDTLKQAQQSQQANLQRVAQGSLPPSMQGIAAAPGAQTAAQPKAMASGGIVAFAGDDPDVGSVVPPTTEQNPDFDENGNPRSRDDRDAVIAQNERLRVLKNKPLLVGRTQDDRVISHGTPEGIERQQQFYKPRNPGAVAPATPAAPAAMPGLGGPSAAGVRQHQVGDAGTSGIATLPAAGGGARASTGATRVGPSGSAIGDFKPDADLRAEVKRMYSIDPKAEREAEEKRIGEKLNTRDEEAQRRKYIDEQRALMAKDFDPEKNREEGLIRFLIGAGGRAYGELGAGAAAGLDYDAAQRAAKLKRMETIQGKEEGLQALKRKAIEDSIGAGQTAYTGASKNKDAGITAGTQAEATSERAYSAKLAAEMDKLKVQAQMAHTAAIKEGNDYAKLQGALNTILDKQAQITEKIRGGFKQEAGMLQMQLMAKPDDPALQHSKAALDAKIDALIDKETKGMAQQADDLRMRIYGSAAGGTGSSGYTVRLKKAPTQ